MMDDQIKQFEQSIELATYEAVCISHPEIIEEFRAIAKAATEAESYSTVIGTIVDIAHGLSGANNEDADILSLSLKLAAGYVYRQEHP